MAIYNPSQRQIQTLVSRIWDNTLWLPDLQRPYVWERARVRNLFDSLYRWYPTWLITLLENDKEANTIWWHWKLQKIPQYSLIDWQQRLTALYATITGTPVIRENWKEESIVISFNPIEEIFEVADAGTKGADWIYDIKDIINSDDLWWLCNRYIEKYREKYWEDPEKESKIWKAINKVHNIKNINFQCIDIEKTTPIETVAEVFLRINSWWKTLQNSDFILTLMSVYWEHWRDAIEKFSSYTIKQNWITSLLPDEIVRILLWVWLKKSRLEQIYASLRKQTDDFDKLDRVVDDVTSKNNWQNFLTILKDAWFISPSLISQKSLLITCYIFYLIWLKEYHMNFQDLCPIIKKYYVAMFLSQKYSMSSTETILWKDLAELEKVTTKEEFINFLEDQINQYLTQDVRNIKLKNAIKESARIDSPLAIIYNAAQVYFQKPILFRNVPLSQYYLNYNSWAKSEIDSHHIFPRQYLLDLWYSKLNEINQIANKVWAYNIDNKFISKKAPEEYYQEFCEKEQTDFANNLEDNCIPSNFYKLTFEEFVETRRDMMLKFIKNYYDDICNPTTHIKTPNSRSLIAGWETKNVEFKSSFRWDYYQNKVNDDMKFQVIKTIAAFLNSDGGTLFVWIKDNWEILGEENDINSYQIKTLDSLLKDIDNMIRDNFPNFKALIDVKEENINWKSVIVFHVNKAHSPAYFTYNWKQSFYVRNSASSTALSIEETVNYINEHF